jgi:hypothetical protein
MVALDVLLAPQRHLGNQSLEARAFGWRRAQSESRALSAGIVERDSAVPATQPETRTGVIVIAQRSTPQHRAWPSFDKLVHKPVGDVSDA